jgi:hypothetical protein
MALVLLLTVLAGFIPTVFLRPLFDIAVIPAVDVYVHGAIMTAWFLLLYIQTSLVVAGRTPLHRRMGIFGAFLGTAVFASAIVVNIRSVSWDVDRGFDLALSSHFVWLNFGVMTAFGSLFAAAIICRKRSEIHKRLMLLASISMIGAATSRIGFWPIFDLPEGLFSIGGPLIFIATPLFYELLVTRKTNIVTVAGGLYVVIMVLLLPQLISHTEFGREFVRSLG